MNRTDILQLLTVQNLLLLMLAFGWLWFFPNPEMLAGIRFEAILLWALPAAVLLLGSGAWVIKLVPALREAQLFLDQEIFQHLKSGDALYLGLLTGVAEELLFRGLLQNAWGLIPASLFFGLMHVPGPRYWSYAIWASLMGLALGVLYVFSGNLLLVMCVHMLNNALALVLWPRFRSWYQAAEGDYSA